MGNHHWNSSSLRSRRQSLNPVKPASKEQDITKNESLGLVFPRRKSLNHGGYERLSRLRISMNTTRKTETSQRNAEVVMSWRRSRHRAENEDEVCGGSRKWSCRETTARLWFQLMAEEETSDGIGEQGHGREGSGLVSSINSFLNYYLANRFRMWRSREHIYT